MPQAPVVHWRSARQLFSPFSFSSVYFSPKRFACLLFDAVCVYYIYIEIRVCPTLGTARADRNFVIRNLADYSTKAATLEALGFAAFAVPGAFTETPWQDRIWEDLGLEPRRRPAMDMSVIDSMNSRRKKPKATPPREPSSRFFGCLFVVPTPAVKARNF